MSAAMGRLALQLRAAASQDRVIDRGSLAVPCGKKNGGAQMQRWEYKVADFTKLEKAVPELDRLGADGWEAVGLISTWGAGWRFVHPVALMKRPQPEPAQ